MLSPVRFFATPRTVALQASLSMGFSGQERCSGLPCPPLGDLPDPGIKLRSPALQVGSLPSEPPGMPKDAPRWVFKNLLGVIKFDLKNPSLQNVHTFFFFHEI